jgi:hypothetical protein
VLLAMRPEEGAGELVNEIDGWVVRADRDPLSNGDQPLEVAVDRTEAIGLAAAAMEDRVTVVALAR